LPVTDEKRETPFNMKPKVKTPILHLETEALPALGIIENYAQFIFKRNAVKFHVENGIM